MLDYIRTFLNKLSRNHKLGILLIVDTLTAFICWFVFGPPLAIAFSYDFEPFILNIIKDNIYSFLIPFIASSIYLIYSDFYKSLVRFFDSKGC